MHVSLRENTLGIGHSPAVDDVCQKIMPQNSRTRFCTYCLEFICKNGSRLEFTCPHSPPALPICLLYLFLSFCPPHSLFFFQAPCRSLLLSSCLGGFWFPINHHSTYCSNHVHVSVCMCVYVCNVIWPSSVQKNLSFLYVMCEVTYTVDFLMSCPWEIHYLYF